MKPLIFDYQVCRHEESTPIVYAYNADEALNTIIVKGIEKPFIDLEASDIDFMTKTRMQKESDDNHFNLSELGTKTKIGGEREDLHDFLLELKTKTFTVKERDE